MVSSSGDYSYSSSEEDSRTSATKVRANKDHAKKVINNMPLDKLKDARDKLLKRKEREEIIAEYQEKRRRIQRKKLEAEERLRSRLDGVASDSDVEEEELLWEPMEHKSRLYPPHREIERQGKADLQDERDEEDYWDAIHGDFFEEEFSSSDSDSEKESEEYSSEDDNDDDESDDSDDCSCS
ncbi:glutamic acid-rich protein-like [Papaver somniferum]|uniref:glutamic acid-rich protein-like n=1 Tax=Papaver somniferum TaxID=3469 RepID=UPI000E700050|nr:glutamic acid-rich protein-like [Papaver somniferum]